MTIHRGSTAGHLAERAVEAVWSLLASRGEGLIHRTGEATRRVGRNGRHVTVGAGPADYHGVITAPSGHGVAVAVEVKSTLRGSWRPGVVRPHQLEELASWSRCGGVALLLVCLNAGSLPTKQARITWAAYTEVVPLPDDPIWHARLVTAGTPSAHVHQPEPAVGGWGTGQLATCLPRLVLRAAGITTTRHT